MDCDQLIAPHDGIICIVDKNLLYSDLEVLDHYHVIIWIKTILIQAFTKCRVIANIGISLIPITLVGVVAKEMSLIDYLKVFMFLYNPCMHNVHFKIVLRLRRHILHDCEMGSYL